MIIFINGASSSGKTSLSRALQSIWASPLIYWSLDSVIAQLPFHYTGDTSDAKNGFPLEPAKTGGFDVGVGEEGLKLNELSATYMRSIADKGFDVVADFVLLDEKILQPYRSSLADIPLLFVGLYCDTNRLSERNRNRADRAMGLALNQQKKIHFCASSYDLTLDSSDRDPAMLAEDVISFINETPQTKGFTNYRC